MHSRPKNVYNMKMQLFIEDQLAHEVDVNIYNYNSKHKPGASTIAEIVHMNQVRLRRIGEASGKGWNIYIIKSSRMNSNIYKKATKSIGLVGEYSNRSPYGIATEMVLNIPATTLQK